MLSGFRSTRRQTVPGPARLERRGQGRVRVSRSAEAQQSRAAEESRPLRGGRISSSTRRTFPLDRGIEAAGVRDAAFSGIGREDHVLPNRGRLLPWKTGILPKVRRLRSDEPHSISAAVRKDVESLLTQNQLQELLETEQARPIVERRGGARLRRAGRARGVRARARPRRRRGRGAHARARGDRARGPRGRGRERGGEAEPSRPPPDPRRSSAPPTASSSSWPTSAATSC